MLNGLSVLTGCDVTLSVAGKGRLTIRMAGNAYTMPHLQSSIFNVVTPKGICHTGHVHVYFWCVFTAL